MFGLLDSGLADIKVIAVGALIALGLKFYSSKFTAESIKDNALQGVIAVLLTILAFVDKVCSVATLLHVRSRASPTQPKPKPRVVDTSR